MPGAHSVTDVTERLTLEPEFAANRHLTDSSKFLLQEPNVRGVCRCVGVSKDWQEPNWVRRSTYQLQLTIIDLFV